MGEGDAVVLSRSRKCGTSSVSLFRTHRSLGTFTFSILPTLTGCYCHKPDKDAVTGGDVDVLVSAEGPLGARFGLILFVVLSVLHAVKLCLFPRRPHNVASESKCPTGQNLTFKIWMS